MRKLPLSASRAANQLMSSLLLLKRATMAELPFPGGLPEQRNPARSHSKRPRKIKAEPLPLPKSPIYSQVWKNLKRWLFELPARTVDSIILFSLRWLAITACLSCLGLVGYGNITLKQTHLDTCAPAEVSRGGWISQLCYERP